MSYHVFEVLPMDMIAGLHSRTLITALRFYLVCFMHIHCTCVSPSSLSPAIAALASSKHVPAWTELGAPAPERYFTIAMSDALIAR
jgi:hypothetical protein